MVKKREKRYEEATPNPEFLIKAISEQGYSFESAVADLIDNSISANATRIEIIANTDFEPFTLYLADDGDGMDIRSLNLAMRFPSGSQQIRRANTDLGRFGLGLKTASFSQTRKVTVISKPSDEQAYSARTWDVEYLENGKWRFLINTDEEIEDLVNRYKSLSENHLNQFENYKAKTIVVWQGLYKYEKYVDVSNRKNALRRDLTDVTAEHLEIVFHRFMEKKKNRLSIRINNKILSPFNPFPTSELDCRALQPLKRKFGDDSIKIEGFILPSRSIDDDKQGSSIWTTKYRNLIAMEGVYIYRCNRIILFGGWNRLVRKSTTLQLARMRVDVGNGIDNLISLNVSKSQVFIPHDLKHGLEEYVGQIKTEAEREYYNRGNRGISGNLKTVENDKLFIKVPSSKGVLFEFNDEFPLIKKLKGNLDKENMLILNVLMRIIKTNINKIRRVDSIDSFVELDDRHDITVEGLKLYIDELNKCGLSSSKIKEKMIGDLGVLEESLPSSIVNLLDRKNGTE